MIYQVIPLLLITLKTARCSLVIDSIAQKGIYVSDYCPEMPYCKEGAHVMCMYYDPNSVTGPLCHNAQNISMSTALANQLVDVSNAIRSKIASGKETGKNGTLLPRGYGIYRLKWDSELATFAQVLANQCVFRHDLCRATKRFPDPGQTTGLVRFKFPDWIPLAQNMKGSAPGLSDSKLAYAVTISLKSWYGQKNQVTEQMIRSYPDWSLTPNALVGHLYMEMIYGTATHMGCGISAYTEYVYHDNLRQENHNSIQVICNYSARPRKGGSTYNVHPPLPGQGVTLDCGCPLDTDQDDDCLCIEKPQVYPDKPVARLPTCPRPDGDCETTLVLLPIFTVEDAPASKLIERTNDIQEPLKNFIMQKFNNGNIVPRSRSGHRLDDLDFFDNHNVVDLFQLPDRTPHKPLKSMLTPPLSSLQQNNIFYRAPIDQPELPTLAPHKSSRRPLPPLPLPRLLPVTARPAPPFPPTLPPPPLPTPRYFPPPPPPRPRNLSRPPKPPSTYSPQIHEENHYDSPNTHHRERENIQHDQYTPKLPQRHLSKTKKSSIFTRVPQFKLPGKKNMHSPFEIMKKDVIPRKNFSNIHKIVTDYLNRRSSFRRNAAVSLSQQVTEKETPVKEVTQPVEQISVKEEVTETILNKVEEKVMNFNQLFKQKENVSNDNNMVEAKITSESLMALLDTLETTVKHYNLDINDKELFDARIRKIYGIVAGRRSKLITQNNIILQNKQTNNVQNIPENEFAEVQNYARQDDTLIEDDKIIEDENKVNQDFMNRKRKGKKYDNVLDPAVFSDIDKKHENFDLKNYNVDRKYGDNSDHKYNENKYGTAQHKSVDNSDRKYSDNFDPEDHKYSMPVSRNQAKYERKDGIDVKESKHSIQTSREDLKYRNYDKYNDHVTKSSRGSMYRSKDDRKYRSKKTQSTFYDMNDPLSLERRKYYQEKIDNLERKLQKTRNFRRSRTEHTNDRQMRRMRPNRDGSRPRARQKAHDSFYMPERARFLHGFR